MVRLSLALVDPDAGYKDKYEHGAAEIEGDRESSPAPPGVSPSVHHCAVQRSPSVRMLSFNSFTLTT